MRKTLAAARRQRKLRPEELARLSSLSLATIYRLEAGTTPNPSIATVEALEDALRLPHGTLVFGEQPIEAAP